VRADSCREGGFMPIVRGKREREGREGAQGLESNARERERGS
jgi:hypothetical protein